MGHTVRQSGRQGAANSIWIQPGTGGVYGVADKRDAAATVATVGKGRN